LPRLPITAQSNLTAVVALAQPHARLSDAIRNLPLFPPVKRSPKGKTHQSAEQRDGNVEKAYASATGVSQTKPATGLHDGDDRYYQSQDEWQDDALKKLRQDPFHVHKPTKSRLQCARGS
jgi:hypothetical protein